MLVPTDRDLRPDARDAPDAARRRQATAEEAEERASTWAGSHAADDATVYSAP
jgi:hypothetical protein